MTVAPGAPTIAVVIPTFDRREELLGCLQSLAAQRFGSFEVLVVDDGSSDGTDAAVAGFAEAHPSLGVRYESNGGNLGANVARNRGVRSARAPIVAFLDSDCRPEPGWLAEIAAAMEDPEVSAVTGLVTNPPPRNIWELAYSGTSRVGSPEAVGKLSDARRIVAGNLAVRRELLLRMPFEEDLKYGCNEEGLFHRLRIEGRRVAFASKAVVLHDHPYDGGSFLRRARILGSAAAWLVYRYRLPPRLDVLPFIATGVTLPVGLVDPRALLIPAGCLVAGVSGLLYAERSRKGKSWGDSIRSLPALLPFYLIKSAAYAMKTLSLNLLPNSIQRTDRRGRGSAGPPGGKL